MRIIDLSIGAEDYGHAWAVSFTLFECIISVGESRMHRLVLCVAIGWLCNRTLVWGLRELPRNDLGPWAAIKRSAVRTFAGWRAP